MCLFVQWLWLSPHVMTEWRSCSRGHMISKTSLGSYLAIYGMSWETLSNVFNVLFICVWYVCVCVCICSVCAHTVMHIRRSENFHESFVFFQVGPWIRLWSPGVAASAFVQLRHLTSLLCHLSMSPQKVPNCAHTKRDPQPVSQPTTPQPLVQELIAVARCLFLKLCKSLRETGVKLVDMSFLLTYLHLSQETAVLWPLGPLLHTQLPPSIFCASNRMPEAGRFTTGSQI